MRQLEAKGCGEECGRGNLQHVRTLSLSLVASGPNSVDSNIIDVLTLLHGEVMSFPLGTQCNK